MKSSPISMEHCSRGVRLWQFLGLCICKSLWGRGGGKRPRKELKGVGSGATDLSVKRNLTGLLHLCRYFRTGRSMYETELMLAPSR